MHYCTALRYRGAETYFIVTFFSLRQANQFGSYNDLHPAGKIKSFFFFYILNTVSKIMLDIRLGPVTNAVGLAAKSSRDPGGPSSLWEGGTTLFTTKVKFHSTPVSISNVAFFHSKRM